MRANDDVTREVRRSASDPKIGAFFDVDRTLLAGFSAASFLWERLVTGHLSPRQLGEALLAAGRFELGRSSFPSFVEDASAGWKGLTEQELREFGERVFERDLAAAIYPEARALVQAHRLRGHTVAIVSSATRFQTEALARDLGIDHVMCTELETKQGRFTGRIQRPGCYAEGKAEAARRLAASHDLDLERSYFYTDSHEDLPLLELVGNPRPVNPNGELAAIALRRGWPVRRFSSRGTPGPEALVRTALAVGSVVPSMLAGVPAALLNRSLRDLVNLGIGAWGDFGTALAGIELRVEGEEHLWSERPAVFIFNHQSGLDALLVSKLVRRDVVGIAKQEVRRHPIFGPAFALAGTVFIDRSDRGKAIEALQPAVDTLRKGISIAIAPEGTRSPSPRPGRFKKGAFHLALQAQVPIVPIVFCNTLDALPKHALVVRPATVDVVVHPPIATRGWLVEELDERIEEVRRLYLETLAL